MFAIEIARLRTQDPGETSKWPACQISGPVVATKCIGLTPFPDASTTTPDHWRLQITTHGRFARFEYGRRDPALRNSADRICQNMPPRLPFGTTVWAALDDLSYEHEPFGR